MESWFRCVRQIIIQRNHGSIVLHEGRTCNTTKFQFHCVTNMLYNGIIISLCNENPKKKLWLCYVYENRKKKKNPSTTMKDREKGKRQMIMNCEDREGK